MVRNAAEFRSSGPLAEDVPTNRESVRLSIPYCLLPAFKFCRMCSSSVVFAIIPAALLAEEAAGFPFMRDTLRSCKRTRNYAGQKSGQRLVLPPLAIALVTAGIPAASSPEGLWPPARFRNLAPPPSSAHYIHNNPLTPIEKRQLERITRTNLGQIENRDARQWESLLLMFRSYP